MIVYFRRKTYEWTDEQFTGIDGVMPVLYSDIRFVDGVPHSGDTSLGNADVFYFRAVGSEYNMAGRLVNYAVDNHIRVVDEYLITDGVTPRTKDVQAQKLAEAGIMQPDFHVVQNLDMAHELVDGIGYPAVVKFSKGGREGKGTFLVRENNDFSRIHETLLGRSRARSNGEDAPWHANKGSDPFVVQQYIPNGGDYRAICIGYECAGITKRRRKEERLVLDTSHGKSKRFKNNRWPSDVGDVAAAASQAMHVQFSGVDLVRHAETGDIYVIEVNEAPSFYFFQKRTKLPVAQMLVDWMNHG